MKKLCLSLCTVFLFMNTGWQCFAQGFYDDFTWNSFRGKDYITDAKDQDVQGPCHIFAAIAQVESMFELLYFNDAELNLSERHLYSPCVQIFDSIYPFLSHPDKGVVQEHGNYPDYEWPESDFYFENANCTNPDGYYKYRISWAELNISNWINKQIQDAIYEYGPLATRIEGSDLIHDMGAGGGGHSLLLHGWTISNDTLHWIFKDSWPGEATHNYQVNAVKLDLGQLYYDDKCNVKKITAVYKYEKVGGSWNPVSVTRSCNHDEDGDGYCFWGVGPKPCSHGIYSEQDYNDDPDDDGNTKGPLLTDGYAKGYAKPLPYVTAPVGQTVIYGPPQSGSCSASHTLNSSYWKNITGDNIDWVPYYGSTPTSYTGPSSSAPGASGLYLYLEPTGGCYNQTGIVESKYHFYIPSGSSNYALKYYYHMYGSTMGTLKVKIQTYPDTDWELKSTKSGNKGNNWFYEQISLTNYKNKYIKIRFEGTTGYGQYSDMAIQNISLPYTGSSKSATVDNSKNAITDNVKQVAKPEEQAHVFKLFPNPASNQLNIITKEGLDYNLAIYNTLGQLVYNEKLKSSQIIDVSILPKGIYIVRIMYNDPEEKEFRQNLIIN